MRARTLSLLASLFAAVAFVRAAPAQVSYLGIPGYTGCVPGGGPAPILTFTGTPSQATGTFSLLYGGALGFSPGNPRVLLLGDFATPPLPVPALPPLCSPSAFAGCYAYVNVFGFYVTIPVN